MDSIESKGWGTLLHVMNREQNDWVSFLKEPMEFVFNPSNHLIGIGPKLDGNTLHNKASSWEWTAIFCLNWLTCSIGFVQPLYMANDGWWKRLESFALSIPRVKGDFEIWLNAFFITSFPTPLWVELLRFLWWKYTSSQEKDSLGGVLERCLYTVSSSSLEETLELEGYCFCLAWWSCFFKSLISRCMALSSPYSWTTWPFLRKPIPFVWTSCMLPSWWSSRSLWRSRLWSSSCWLTLADSAWCGLVWCGPDPVITVKLYWNTSNSHRRRQL